ncbi:hypothetical protein ACQP3F_32080, partial [Escherichia coli]
MDTRERKTNIIGGEGQIDTGERSTEGQRGEDRATLGRGGQRDPGEGRTEQLWGEKDRQTLWSEGTSNTGEKRRE